MANYSFKSFLKKSIVVETSLVAGVGLGALCITGAFEKKYVCAIGTSMTTSVFLAIAIALICFGSSRSVASTVARFKAQR